MTILLIGGAYQGKFDYACRTFHLTESDFLPHADVHQPQAWAQAKAVNDLHLLLRDSSVDPKMLLPLLKGKVIICDEIGGGIVPADAEARAWRETVGRLCCDIAEFADHIERIYMGMSTLIK